MDSNRNSDAWVLWLTGSFVLIAIAVFVIAIVRHRTNSEAPSTSLSPAPILRTTESGEFRAVRIIDGDSLTLVGSDGIELSIRLRGVDAPELGQPHGLEAKQALRKLVESTIITLDEPKKGKYGRYVANLYAGGIWVNKMIVVEGHAWCDQVNSFDKVLYAAEREAKQDKVGLWVMPEPVPPWVWRAERK